MSAIDPSRLGARAAMVRGWRELWRAPLLTLAAVGGAMTAALAVRAAWSGAGAALEAGHPGRAALTWLSGASLAALLVEVTRAAALTAYAGPPRPLGQTLALGLERTPGMLGVGAVELFIYLALGAANLSVLARIRQPAAAPSDQALLAATLLLPSQVLAVLVFGAARVAQTLIARGLPPATSLVHGCDVVLRRFATLVRLALLGALAVAPLLAVAVWLPFALRAALASLAALWLYAALALLVGRDGRLSTG